MISNMKSDQAKFNIEINNDKKFEQPNFDRPDCQEKGKNRYSKTQQQEFHLWASFYKLQKNTTPPYYFYPFFLSKLLKKKKLLQPKTKK